MMVWRTLILLLTVILVFLSPSSSRAQGEVSARKYPEHFGDLFGSTRFLLGKRIIRGDVGTSFSRISYSDQPGKLTEFYRSALRTNLVLNPFSDFQIRGTLYTDFISREKAPIWLADFFYQVGYYNWRDYTFSLGYENYQPNRFRNAQIDFLTNARRGHFFLSYTIALLKHNDSWSGRFSDETTKILVIPIVRVQPEYVDMQNQRAGNWRPVAGSSIRYILFRNIYVESAAYWYPIAGTRLPWDPDFTYGFGISNWRAFKLNLTYGNWIANRFPWESEGIPHGFLNGEFVLNFTFAW